MRLDGVKVHKMEDILPLFLYYSTTALLHIVYERLFYLLKLGSEPLNVSFSVRFFGHIVNVVADDSFDDILINSSPLCHSDKLDTPIMRAMARVDV